MELLIYFIIIMTLPLFIQMYLKRTYSKYSEVGTSSGITGAEAAEKALQDNGVYNVNVEPVKGKLTDHYDPRSKTVRLSEGNYYGNSIAAISVATHEVGHAVQDAEEYSFLKFRTAFAPVASFGSSFSFLFILGGMLLQMGGLLGVGIAFFALAVLFQLITLPVEFNASSRGREMMVSSGMIRNDEEGGAKKVLNAAALTYVAATVVAVMELLRFILMYMGMNDD